MFSIVLSAIGLVSAAAIVVLKLTNPKSRRAFEMNSSR